MSENELVPFSGDAALDITLDSDVKLNMIEKFPSLAKDETARISLIAFDTAGGKNSPRLKLSQYYYVDNGENNRFSFTAPKNKEMLAKVVRALGEPKIRFGTIVVRYQTDKNGIVMKNADGTLSFNYYVWLIGTDKWNALKSMHQEWNLFGRDMLVKWDGKSDIKFQNLTMQPAQDCYWKHMPDANSIMEQGNALYEQSVMKFLAREIPDAELAIKLGWDTAPIAPNPINPFASTPQAQIADQSGTTTAENPFSKIVKPS